MHLDLSRNKLRVIPDLNLPVLENLDMSHNQLEELPTRFLLPKLQCLDLLENNFATLPRINSKELTQLKYLTLCNNDLYDIAADTVALCRAGCALKWLEIKGNERLSVPPPEIVERGGEAVWKFFVDLTALSSELVCRGCLLNVVGWWAGVVVTVAVVCGYYCCCWLLLCLLYYVFASPLAVIIFFAGL